MRSRWIWAALAVVAALACGKDKGAAQGPYAKDVAEAIPIIERGTGLKFKHPPVLETRTKAQVRQFLEERFRQELPDSEIQGEQLLYRRLGLIPDTLDLRKFMLDLLTEQVAGFYDPKTKKLYVVEGAPPEQVNMIVTHELVHALQDQYMNLDSVQDVKGANDRSMAAQAVIEGQATLVPIQALLGPGAGMPAGWDRVREMIRENQTQMPVLASAPFVLQETLIFPYLTGAEFMRRFEAERKGETPFGPNMPTSTEQVLHPDRYFAAHRDLPTRVDLPRPAAGSVLYADDLGEFETRLFLFQHLHDQPAALRGAAGWDGDRYEVVRTPRGDGIAWLTVWDSPVDAAEFSSDVEQVMAKRFPSARATGAAGGKRWSVPGARVVTVWGGDVDGRAAVLYTDVPDGVEPNLLDVKKVRLDSLAR
ncbi:MAG TPA: hypothetical protein VFS44_15840 [Gemmatimonadaceae bacterium]|nr:hypothetical protein [Gemmatimonadaceae bacterium]